MRVTEHRVDSGDTSIDGFVRLLDDFAALPAAARTHSGRRGHGRPQARRAVSDRTLIAKTLVGTRVGLAGLLLTLLVGGLGFAVWTGPQSCVGCDDALVVAPSAQASDNVATASRLEYTAMADLDQILKHQPSQSAYDWSAPSKSAELRSAELPNRPVLAAAKAEDTITPSPITTSATGRLYEPKSLTEAKPPQHSGRLPAITAEVSDLAPKPLKFSAAAEVSDAASKPLKLTAANEITNQIAPPPSVLAVARSPVNEVAVERSPVNEVAVERSPVNEVAAVYVPARKPKASSPKSPQIQSQWPRRRARARKRVKAAQNNSVPAWAMKMFVGNWQDKAFAYQYQ